MIQRIVNRELFSFSRAEKIIVGRDEHEGRQVLGLQYLVGYQSGCQLNSIIPAQTVILGQLDSAVNNKAIHRQK